MTTPDQTDSAALLLTGATGFVGGHLLAGLLEAGPVRCLVRDGSKLFRDRGVQAIQADLLEQESLRPALEGMEEVYYLVHSMEPGVGDGFADQDRRAAENFAAIAAECGIRRTIYLGGVQATEGSSEHIESRNEVEQLLAGAGEEFVALRASMIVGAGSASFKTLVQLVSRLPVMPLPSWRERRSQPVAIADVVAALVAARDVEPGVYEIAGPDLLTFERMTEVVAKLLETEHRSFALPFSSSALESRAAGAVVDADQELLEPLMAGLHSDLVVEENALEPVFGVIPTPFAEAARVAIEGIQDDDDD